MILIQRNVVGGSLHTIAGYSAVRGTTSEREMAATLISSARLHGFVVINGADELLGHLDFTHNSDKDLGVK